MTSSMHANEIGITTEPLSLCFKGNRDYLHGTDIYESVTAFARKELGHGLDRLQMTLHRFFSTQPDMHWIAQERRHSGQRDSVVDFSVAAGARKAMGWLTASGRRVERRVAYEEERIEAQCTLAENSISISGDTGFLPIEVAVSMTKVLHVKRVPATSGRWIFTKLDMRRLFEPADASRLAINLGENLYGRLTKSGIFAAGQNIGSIYFSLVQG
jgi:hypothetical protein